MDHNKRTLYKIMYMHGAPSRGVRERYIYVVANDPTEAVHKAKEQNDKFTAPQTIEIVKQEGKYFIID